MYAVDVVLFLLALFPSLLILIFATGSLIGFVSMIKEAVPAIGRTRRVREVASRTESVAQYEQLPVSAEMEFGGACVAA